MGPDPAERVIARVTAALVVAFDVVVLVVLWAPVAGINDVVGLIAGGRAILEGVDPYDPDRWTAFASAVGQVPETRVFGYPPWIALAFAPLALLPLLVASIVWTAGGLLLVLALAGRYAERLGWPRIPALLLAGASWPAVLVLVQGQWGFVLVALAVLLFLAIREGRDIRAGIVWGAMVLAKPQLFVLGSLGLAGWALVRRRPRIVLAAMVTVIAGVVAGTTLAPGWIAPYAQLVLAVRGVRSTQQPTLAGLAADVAGPLWPVAWLAAVIALAALAVAATRRSPAPHRHLVALSSGLALSVAAAPYSWSYDHYLVVPLGATIAGLGAELTPRRRRALLLALAILFGPLALLLWETAYLRWHDTLAGLVPPLAIALAFAATRALPAPRRTP